MLDRSMNALLDAICSLMMKNANSIAFRLLVALGAVIGFSLFLLHWKNELLAGFKGGEAQLGKSPPPQNAKPISTRPGLELSEFSSSDSKVERLPLKPFDLSSRAPSPTGLLDAYVQHAGWHPIPVPSDRRIGIRFKMKQILVRRDGKQTEFLCRNHNSPPTLLADSSKIKVQGDLSRTADIYWFEKGTRVYNLRAMRGDEGVAEIFTDQ